jgi:hypothetical protein
VAVEKKGKSRVGVGGEGTSGGTVEASHPPARREGILLKLLKAGHTLHHPVCIASDYDPMQDALIRDFNEWCESPLLSRFFPLLLPSCFSFFYFLLLSCFLLLLLLLLLRERERERL